MLATTRKKSAAKGSRIDTPSVSALPVNRFPLSLFFVLIILITFILPAKTGFAQQPGVQAAQNVGLEMNCPVLIIEEHRLVKGDRQYASIYDGVTYFFSSRDAQAKFDADPVRYIPALGGDCVVCFADSGTRTPGVLQFASIYKDRLYLFPDGRSKQVFDNAPQRFDNVDLVGYGKSIVWLSARNRHVRGSARFSEVHNGYRYQFVSNVDRAEFAKDPGRYETLAMQIAQASRRSPIRGAQLAQKQSQDLQALSILQTGQASALQTLSALQSGTLAPLQSLERLSNSGRR